MRAMQTRSPDRSDRAQRRDRSVASRWLSFRGRCQVMLSAGIVLWASIACVVAPLSAQNDADQRPAQPAGRQRPREKYIGVFAEPVSAALHAQFADLLKDADGVLVRRVVDNSPAAAAGIAEYDILVSVAGEPLRDLEHLKSVIAAQQADSEVPVVVIRRAQPEKLRVRIAERIKVNTPRAPAGIRVRNPLQSNAAPLEVGPDGVKPLDRKTSSWSISVLSLDGQRYQVQLDLENAEDVTLSGTPDELRQQAAEKLPRVLADEVRRLVDQLQPLTQQQAFRFRLQPRLEGTDRILHVSLLQPGRGGALRLFEMDHNFGDVAQLDAADLLDVTALQEQLQQLTPGVRRRVEETLREIEIPPIQVQVHGSL